jgi:hypothetical protein
MRASATMDGRGPVAGKNRLGRGPGGQGPLPVLARSLGGPGGPGPGPPLGEAEGTQDCERSAQRHLLVARSRSVSDGAHPSGPSRSRACTSRSSPPPSRGWSRTSGASALWPVDRGVRGRLVPEERGDRRPVHRLERAPSWRSRSPRNSRRSPSSRGVRQLLRARADETGAQVRCRRHPGRPGLPA